MQEVCKLTVQLLVEKPTIDVLYYYDDVLLPVRIVQSEKRQNIMVSSQTWLGSMYGIASRALMLVQTHYVR